MGLAVREANVIIVKFVKETVGVISIDPLFKKVSAIFKKLPFTYLFHS